MIVYRFYLTIKVERTKEELKMRIRWFVLFSIIVLTLGILAGCGSNVNEVQPAPAKEVADESTTGEEANDEVADSKAQMMIANYIISEQGFHEMDEQIAKGELDDSFLRNVQQAKSIAESITWDPSLDEVIATFNKDINELEQALIANDVKKAKEQAAALHESQHDLDNAVSQLVKTMTGPDMKAQMMIANFIISEQGFHEMDEQIAKGELDDSFLRNVQQAKSIAESITWDPSLDEVIATFNKDINELEQALIANDVEKAKEPAAALHESQHDLDNAVSQLVKTMTGPDMKAQMMIANFIISEQGFHEMDEQIAKGELDDSFLRNVQQAKSIAESITWDPSLDEVIATFNKDINELEQALIANDVEKAKEPAAALHESQHDLDNAVSQLVKTMTGPDMKAQMMIANFIISEQGFHEMDEQIAKGELDDSFLRNVQQAKSIAESITWDPSLDEIIATFNEDINELEQALIANDVEQAKEPAAALHESQHELDNAVSNLIKEFVQLTNDNQAESKSENQIVDVDEVDGTVLTMYDWDFDDIKLEKGKNVIILKNEGDMPHGVLIPELGLMSDDVGGGETLIWEIDVDETGEFTFYCSIPECGTPEQHSEMIGEVIVE